MFLRLCWKASKEGRICKSRREFHKVGATTEKDPFLAPTSLFSVGGGTSKSVLREGEPDYVEEGGPTV